MHILEKVKGSINTQQLYNRSLLRKPETFIPGSCSQLGEF